MEKETYNSIAAVKGFLFPYIINYTVTMRYIILLQGLAHSPVYAI